MAIGLVTNDGPLMKVNGAQRSTSLNAYLAGFATILIVPLLLLSLYVTYSFAEAERTRLEAMVDNTNQDLVLLIDHEITARVGMLRTLSTAQTLQTGDIQRFEAQVRELSRLENMQFIMTDMAGQQLINTIVAPGESLPKTNNPDLFESSEIKYDVLVSNLFNGSVTGRALVQVSIPLRRNGSIFAILSATILPEKLFEIVRDGLPPGPFYATILDRHGTIIVRSIDPAKYIGQPLPTLANGAQGEKGSLSMVSADGVPVFVYWRRPTLSGWVVAAAIERSALTAPLIDSLRVLLLAIVAASSLVILSALWIGRRLTRAHGALVGAVERIGQGQYVEPFTTPLREVNRVGEVLVTASHALRQQDVTLRQINHELEQRVSQRTEELKEKAALLETTIDAMRQGLIVVTADGRVPICSARARMLLDLPDDLLRGGPSFDRILDYQNRHAEYDHLPEEARRRLHPLAEPSLADFEYERPNGTILQIHTTAVMLGLGVVRTITDITDQARHARDLEEARDAAEHANRAKDEFLANISHEMRTPLNAVIGYSEILLQDTQTSPVSARHAERIHESSTALLKLVDDVLDFERVESGHIETRIECFALEALVDSALSIVRPQIGAKDFTLEQTIRSEKGRYFYGERERISQILINLLSNAVKFTRAGRVAVAVDCQDGSEGKATLRFEVSDTGIGIGAEDQTLIFQRFHQVDGSNRRRFKGAGLGLTISKQLVEKLGGSIGLVSDLGSGSTFWFEIPVTAAKMPTPALAAPRAAHRRGARILVAEDVILNQELARELLERDGYSVDVVPNGFEAVVAARSTRYDLILMDLSMPEMDGLTATRLIRESEADAQHVPIVACTANVLSSHKAAFLAVGIDAYLCKPLRQEELYATLDSVLFRTEKGPGSGRTPEPDAPQVDTLVSLLGSTRVLQSLEHLKIELAILDKAQPSDLRECASVARQAHAIISIASVLEFDELMTLCRDIEGACTNVSATNRTLDRLKKRTENFTGRIQAMIETTRRTAA